MNQPESQSIPHFFIYDEQGTEQNEKLYSFGDMVIADKNLFKNNTWNDAGLFMEALEDEIALLTPKKSGIVIYIHGYQADNVFFMQKSGYILQDKIFNNDHSPYGLVLSLQWSSVIPYTKAVELAYTKGCQFAYFVMRITQILRAYHPESPVSFICHSMGNRVFQGLYETWALEQANLKLNHVFFMAADLESSVFEQGFGKIGQNSRHIHVYYNHEDVTLSVANALVKHPRLGIYGTLDYHCPNNCNQRDVTGLEDDRSFVGTFTHHRYFYGSRTVRNEIIQHLAVL